MCFLNVLSPFRVAPCILVSLASQFDENGIAIMGRWDHLARALCSMAPYLLPHLSPQLRRHHRRRLQAQEAVTQSC